MICHFMKLYVMICHEMLWDVIICWFPFTFAVSWQNSVCLGSSLSMRSFAIEEAPSPLTALCATLLTCMYIICLPTLLQNENIQNSKNNAEPTRFYLSSFNFCSMESLKIDFSLCTLISFSNCRRSVRKAIKIQTSGNHNGVCSRSCFKSVSVLLIFS